MVEIFSGRNMYRERGPGGSRSEVTAVDRKQRMRDALEKHPERSSPSTSRAINGKDKSAHSVLLGKAPSDHRDSARHKTNCSGGSPLSSTLTYVIYMALYGFVCYFRHRFCFSSKRFSLKSSFSVFSVENCCCLAHNGV